MPSLSREISPDSPLHKMILVEVQRRMRIAEKEFAGKREEWTDAENQVLAYVPEQDADAVRRDKRDRGGLPQYTTIQIPYTYGVTLSAFTYWATVFFSRDPWFQFQGRHGEGEQNTQCLEALISYQMLQGECQGPMYSWLFDAARYGVGVLSLYWDEEIRPVTKIELQETIDPMTGVPLGPPKKIQTTTQLDGYKGNKIANVNPKDFLFDPRVGVREFQKGEFCGQRVKLPWHIIMQRERQGYYVNIDQIDRHITPRFQEEWSSDTSALERPQDNFVDQEWGTGDQKRQAYPTKVPVYEAYIRIIPSDWKLSNSDYPEIWVFTITGDFKAVIGAQPLGADHGRFPFVVLEIEQDPYALTNRGIPKTINTVQNTIDWLMNSHFYNVRASLNNLFVVDPTRVSMKDIAKPGPGGVIRLKPGWDMKSGKAIEQLTVTDVTTKNLMDVHEMLGIGERITGVNDQIMGVLNQAVGRKTATEVRQSSTFGANRQKTICEYMGATGFTQLANLLVSNTQQYYDGSMKLRLVGSLAQLAGPTFLTVDPQSIAGAYDYIPVDGTLPVDRFAQASLWKDLMMNMKQFPQLMARTDFFKLFSWVANLAGLKNFQNFQLQMLPQGQMPGPGMVPMPPPGAMPPMPADPGGAPMPQPQGPVDPNSMNGPGNGVGGGPIAMGGGAPIGQ